MRFLTFVSFISILFLLPLQAKEVTITSYDGFKLKADYLKGGNGGPVVLFLHQCNRDRTMWDKLSAELNSAGMHTLSVDFRMFGESVDDENNVAAIRATATSREDYFKKFDAIKDVKWPKDLQSVWSFLMSLEGIDASKVVTVGASCGGDQSLTLQKAHANIKAQVFMSTPLSQDSIRQIQSSANLPRFFFTGSLDPVSDTVVSVQNGYRFSTNNANRLIMYKTEIHGDGLFEFDPLLINALRTWLQQQLE